MIQRQYTYKKNDNRKDEQLNARSFGLYVYEVDE